MKYPQILVSMGDKGNGDMLVKWRNSINLLTLGLMVLLVGCVAGEGGKKTASCGSGQVFDSVSRRCQGATIEPGAPRGTLSSLSILEDSGRTSVNLTYADSEGDRASSCTANSDKDGLIRYLTYQGLVIKVNNDIIDAQNIYVTITNGSPFAVSASTSIFTDIVGLTIQIPSGTNAVSAAANINSNTTADDYISSYAVDTNLITGDGVSRNIVNLPCSCIGGICSTRIEPADNFNGSTDFYYTVTDGDGTSATQTVLVNVTSVNDAPVITQAAPFPVATELLNGSTGSSLSIDLDDYINISDIENNSPYTYQVINQPLYAANLITDGVQGVELNSLTGALIYRTFAQQTTDTIGIRVYDSEGAVSNTLTFTINITNVNDPPVGAITTASSIFEDSTVASFILTVTDEEGDNANICEVQNFNKVFPTSDCVCVSATTCGLSLIALPNQTGTASFSYRVYDDSGSGNVPIFKTVSFSIVGIDDGPLIYPTVVNTTAESTSLVMIRGDESETFAPRDYTFTLDGVLEPDGHTVSSTGYAVTSLPTEGTLSGCLNINGAGGLSCTYTPIDGNVADPVTLDPADSNSYARDTTDVGTFYATTFGSSLDGLQIQLIANNTDGTFITSLFSPSARAYAFANASKVVIIFEPGVTNASDIAAAIASSTEVSKLIALDDGGSPATIQNTEETLTLGGGTDTLDKFTLQVTDSNGDVSTKVFNISIANVFDRPTLCEYSSYDDTTACGLNGCVVSDSSSILSLTPDKDGLTLYNRETGTCYQSSGGSWTPIESFIADRTVNELDPIVIDDILVDESGGLSEDSETLKITNIDSSDENLIPLGNIQIFYGDPLVSLGTGADTAGAGEIDLGDGVTSGDAASLRLIITPQTINPPQSVKTSTIEITVEDSGGKITEVTFVVTVQKVSATHGGWANFKATGPKVDALGLVNEDRTVCPYSLDMCEGGQKCYGTSSPINNTAADPDTEDAVFMQDTSGTVTCYRMKRTQVQNIAYVGKTSSNVTIEYTDGATAGAANVSVSGNAITIQIQDDVTTTDTIIAAIEGNASAHALVKAINLKPAETQDPQSTVTISPLSNASWESFETYCSATPVALEPGCNDGSRKSCVGRSSPVGVVTPTEIDSRFWDEQTNTCYRSTGTTNTDWETYDAPAEVEITWNQFSVNGSASISEYRVYRRLANEEFDFSKPINKESITGSSTTYTFTDNAKNSVVPPSPGTVYYYVVRPVVNGVLTSTAAETGTNANGVVRIMAPPKNMAFAHRWMMNKRICSLMNRSSDSTNNYRCLYKGAGDTTIGGTQYYDFGKDLLVDRFEAGCPFSPAPNCFGTFDNSCIGVTDPATAGITATNGLVYYDRSEGRCYMASGGSWNELENTAIATYVNAVEPNAGDLTRSRNDKSYNRSSLPPLVNISQGQASAFCSGLTDIPASNMVGIANPLSHRLPGRKDQIAYSLWNKTVFTESEMATIETGLSMNSSSKCNSSSASGLEDGYVNFDKPDSNDFYSLPGTDSSGIRSITTGSNESATCTSAFGVQDAVGNVAEWLSNGLDCTTMSTCSPNAGDTNFASSDATDPFGQWVLDGVRGPCVDSDSDNICDANISFWAIEDERFSAGRFMTPMGLPVDISANSTLDTDYDLFEIGPTSGITSLQLHDDTVNINSRVIFSGLSTPTAGQGSLTAGGSYLSGNGAGVWNFEALPDDNGFGVLILQDITYRADDSGDLSVTVRYVENADADIIAVTFAGGVLEIDLDDVPGGSSAANVAAAVNGAAGSPVRAVVSGDSTALQLAFSTPVGFTDLRDQAVNRRVDVGFRCVIDIDSGNGIPNSGTSGDYEQ